jgi:hypothetical protein|tara:strand:+ start:1305 stop:1835 length:531 start_codon:yes stop_codon:yes gene_type:complete
MPPKRRPGTKPEFEPEPEFDPQRALKVVQDRTKPRGYQGRPKIYGSDEMVPYDREEVSKILADTHSDFGIPGDPEGGYLSALAKALNIRPRGKIIQYLNSMTPDELEKFRTSGPLELYDSRMNYSPLGYHNDKKKIKAKRQSLSITRSARLKHRRPKRKNKSKKKKKSKKKSKRKR